jgi:hypothetical protein
MGWLRRGSHTQRVDSPWKLFLFVLVPVVCAILLLRTITDTVFKDLFTSDGSTARLARRKYLQDPTMNGSSLLQRRQDDYSCGSGRPCCDGACCGESSFCGYGNTYCGPGCTSHCDAHAECGKDALIPGTKCPLNTCCSEFGYVCITRYSIFLFIC